MTYAILSLIFLAVAVLVLVVALIVRGRPQLMRRWVAPVVFAGLILGVLTALFDNLMVAGGFMVYHSDAISGVHIGLVPIEDFAYPLAALILLPGLWLLFTKRTPDE